MADEPESDADAPEGADGSIDEEPRPSTADESGAADEPSESGAADESGGSDATDDVPSGEDERREADGADDADSVDDGDVEGGSPDDVEGDADGPDDTSAGDTEADDGTGADDSPAGPDDGTASEDTTDATAGDSDDGPRDAEGADAEDTDTGDDNIEDVDTEDTGDDNIEDTEGVDTGDTDDIVEDDDDPVPDEPPSHVRERREPKPVRVPEYEEPNADDGDGDGAGEGEADVGERPDPDREGDATDPAPTYEELPPELPPSNEHAADGAATYPEPDESESVTDGAGATAGAAGGTGTAGEDEWVDDDWDDDWTDSGIVGEAPESDQEMPLADHIEEMVRRVGVVLLIGLGVSLAVFGLGEASSYVPSSVEIVEYLWQTQVPSPMENRPHVYGPLELLLTELKVAGLTGLIVGLPVLVYESYLFMRPGLYPKERRYYLAAVPTSLVLGVLGVLFAHFVILPNLFAYFTSYTEAAAQGNIFVAYGLRDTFALILVMMGYMAVIFQIPLFIMLAIMMGLTTREWMEERRLLFWGAFLGLSFTFVAVDPTGMAPIVIAVTMVVLFEATLALLRWTGN